MIRRHRLAGDQRETASLHYTATTSNEAAQGFRCPYRRRLARIVHCVLKILDRLLLAVGTWLRKVLHLDRVGQTELPPTDRALEARLDRIEAHLRGLRGHAKVLEEASQERLFNRNDAMAFVAGSLLLLVEVLLAGAVSHVLVLVYGMAIAVTATTIMIWRRWYRPDYGPFWVWSAILLQYGAVYLGASYFTRSDAVHGLIDQETKLTIFFLVCVLAIASWAFVYTRERTYDEELRFAPVMPAVLAGLLLAIFFNTVSNSYFEVGGHEYVEPPEGGVFLLTTNQSVEARIVLQPSTDVYGRANLTRWKVHVAFQASVGETLAGSWAIVTSGDVKVVEAIADIDEEKVRVRTTSRVLPYDDEMGLGTSHGGFTTDMHLDWYSPKHNQIVTGSFDESTFSHDLELAVSFRHPVVSNEGGIIDGRLPPIGCPYDLWSHVADDSGVLPKSLLRNLPPTVWSVPARCISETAVTSLKGGQRIVSSSHPSDPSAVDWVFQIERPALVPRIDLTSSETNPDGSITTRIQDPSALLGFRARVDRPFGLSSPPLHFEVQDSTALSEISDLRYLAGIFAGIAGSSAVWAVQALMSGWPQPRRRID